MVTDRHCDYPTATLHFFHYCEFKIILLKNISLESEENCFSAFNIFFFLRKASFDSAKRELLALWGLSVTQQLKLILSWLKLLG